MSTPSRTPAATWPVLGQPGSKDTYDTLHMWTQIVGKVCLTLTPLINHWWNVALHVTSRGLRTPLMMYGDRVLTMTFDFLAHALVITCSDGGSRSVALAPRTVADFYRGVMQALHELQVDVRIWPMPVEVPHPIRFDQDVTHRSYDPAAAVAFWQSLLAMEPVFAAFRARFIGKASPVHFFWGSFDLATTRFSGERAPERPDADAITREAYSHKVISHGFWLGGGMSNAVSEPAFYAYAAPEPDGFRQAPVRPAPAFYSPDLSLFILPYEPVRTAASPETELTAFLDSTYEAGAKLAGWDRPALERSA